MTPLSTNMDELAPPALGNPIATLATRTAEPVPIKDIEEHVIIEFAGSHARNTVSFFLLLFSSMNVGTGNGLTFKLTSIFPCLFACHAAKDAAKSRPEARKHSRHDSEPEVP